MVRKEIPNHKVVRKTTSIGNSSLSRPKNKSKKLAWKPYKGQGKP